MKSRGIIYVATGLRYFREAEQSLASVRSHLPGMEVTIFTDPATADRYAHSKAGHDNGIRIRALPACQFTYSDKIQGMRLSEYDETLFLDTDTWVCEPCLEIFEPLDKYDLAAVHEVYRSEYSFESIPESFPSLNTGVVVYRNTTAVQEFLKGWEDHHRKEFAQYRPDDQPAFRHQLYHSDLRIFLLPAEYNFRPHYPSFIGGHSNPKIIHDHNPYSEEIYRIVSRSPLPRIFGPIQPRLILYWYWMKLKKRLRRFMTTLRRSVSAG